MWQRFPTPPRPGQRAPRWRAAFGAALVSLTGCSGEPARDALTSRCLDALRYHAPLESLEVEEASLDPRRRSVQIRYASTPSPLGARIPGRILCRHANRARAA